MSESSENLGADSSASAPSWKPSPASDQDARKAELAPNNLPSGAAPDSDRDPSSPLKKRLEETRLPAALKEQILAELPPFAEQEQLYREVQAEGGLSFEQFCESLGIEVQAKS
jgi:hypothetical protein